MADLAVEQAQTLTKLTQRALDDAEVMARNAEMERNLYADKPAGGGDWPDTPQGRQFAWAREQLALILRRFKAVRSAAAFNPRNPPKIGG